MTTPAATRSWLADRPGGASRADPTGIESLLTQPIGQSDVFEQTLGRLLRMIKLGVLQPGDRLPAERELALRLGISRQTLREAIRSLVQAGHLETRRGRSGGTYVLGPDEGASWPDVRSIAEAMGPALADALDLRWVIEPGAAELAAARIDATGRARLDAAMGLLDSVPRLSFPAEDRQRIDEPARDALASPASRVSASGALPSYRAADVRLHLVIADLSGSPSLVDAVADIQLRLTDLFAETPQMTKVLRHSDEQHLRIVEAIKLGNRAEARAEMTAHVESSAAYLRAFLS